MNRAGVLDILKSLVVVVPVTLLIWLLAESESLRIEKMRVEIVLAAADQSNRTIRVAPGQDFRNEATLQIEGPNARVDALVAKLRGPIRLEPGMPGVPLETGLQSIDLQTAISNHPLLRESRVSITDVEPASVPVQIDTVTTKEARVRLELPPEMSLEGAAEVSPPIVKVRLPESSVKLLESWGTGAGGSGGEPEVVARLDRASLAGLAEGRRAVINAVPIELPPGLKDLDSVAVAPGQVSVSLTPRGRTDRWVATNVPVHVRLSPAELGRWSIEVAPEDRVLQEVAISGPGEMVDGYKKGATRLVAFVALGFEDLERAAAMNQGAGGTIEKEPAFTETPCPLRFEPRQKTIRVTIRKRDAR
jgi:hypothetical protein